MKKIISLLLAAVMVIGVAGCTKKTGTESEIPTLTWYVPGNPQSDIASVMNAVNEIIEPKIGAKLDLRILDEGAFSEKMTMMYSAQDVFDLTFVGYCNLYSDSVNLGALMPMGKLLDEYAPKLKEEIPDYVWDAAYVDGEYYAVPNMQIMSSEPGLFFFKDIADKYGITEGMTVSSSRELEPYFEKIKQDYPDIYPTYRANTDHIMKDYWVLVQGPYIFLNQETLEVVCSTDMPETEQSLQLAREWCEKGYTRPDLDTAQSKMQEDLKAGRYASFGGEWKPGIEADYKNIYGRDVVYVRTGRGTLNGGSNTMTGISQTSKHPEKAMQLLELVNTDKEVYNLICYGIEGKHYEKLEGDYIRPISGSGYEVLACWKFGNQFNAYLLEGQDSDVWEQTKEVNDAARVPAQRGFVFDNTSVKNMIAQCNAIEGEYGALNTGVVADWKDKAAERKTRLDGAGQQKIRDEVEKQFKEWYAKKNAQ